MIQIHVKKSLPKPGKAFSLYWKFAAERQHIFFSALGNDHVVTKDAILRTYKFTNAYRASDRVSQYLIRQVIYGDHFSLKDTFFRILLFKIFNRTETWKYLERIMQRISWDYFHMEKYDQMLTDLKNEHKPLYSSAYMMASGKSSFGSVLKHQNHLHLLQKMMKDQLYDKIAEAPALETVFHLLKGYPMMGNFLAFQFAIDLNYSTIINFSEMDFVVAGPGARSGIRKCFTDTGGYSEADIIKWMTDNQDEQFDKMGLTFKNLWGRKLQLIDCQNLFCEVDKYCRVAMPELSVFPGRYKIKQKYRPAGEKIDYWYPPKWKINDKIIVEPTSNQDL